jgi:hypothetical protein
MKKKKTRVTTIQMNSDEGDLKRAADDLGVTVIDLEAILELGQNFREIIVDRELSPPQVMSCLVNLLGETIQTCIKPSSQIECCWDVYQQLLSHIGKKVH